MYSYLFVALYDGKGEYGALSNVVLILNHPPVAQLTADPVEGEAPLTVSFDAARTYDLDGPIVKHEWDWEGDAAYDRVTAAAEHLYVVADCYYPKVRVHDAQGATATAEGEIWVGRWHITVAVDNARANFAKPALAVVNGHPAISYCGESDGPGPPEFIFVRAEDPLGQSWGQPVMVAQPAGYYDTDHARHCLTVVNGSPAIAHSYREAYPPGVGPLRLAIFY